MSHVSIPVSISDEDIERIAEAVFSKLLTTREAIAREEPVIASVDAAAGAKRIGRPRGSKNKSSALDAADPVSAPAGTVVPEAVIVPIDPPTEAPQPAAVQPTPPAPDTSALSEVIAQIKTRGNDLVRSKGAQAVSEAFKAAGVSKLSEVVSLSQAERLLAGIQAALE